MSKLNLDGPNNSIGKEKAIKIYDSEWWKNKSHHEIAKVQLFLEELCCPFSIFHEAVEKTLNRPVFTHEFGINYSGICKEFLGNDDPPTVEEILDIISSN